MQAEIRARLLRKIEMQQQLRQHLVRLKSATAADVEKEFGKPSQTTPCGSADSRCTFYYAYGKKVFFCFDQSGHVTCDGTLASP
jgi:hypothetical protein